MFPSLSPPPHSYLTYNHLRYVLHPSMCVYRPWYITLIPPLPPSHNDYIPGTLQCMSPSLSTPLTPSPQYYIPQCACIAHGISLLFPPPPSLPKWLHTRYLTVHVSLTLHPPHSLPSILHPSMCVYRPWYITLIPPSLSQWLHTLQCMSPYTPPPPSLPPLLHTSMCVYRPSTTVVTSSSLSLATCETARSWNVFRLADTNFIIS